MTNRISNYKMKGNLLLRQLAAILSFEFFTIGVSIRISDRFKVTQNKIYFVKNCPQWGLNSQPPDHHSNALPIELDRNLLGKRFLQ